MRAYYDFINTLQEFVDKIPCQELGELIAGCFVVDECMEAVFAGDSLRVRDASHHEPGIVVVTGLEMFGNRTRFWYEDGTIMCEDLDDGSYGVALEAIVSLPEEACAVAIDLLNKRFGQEVDQQS